MAAASETFGDYEIRSEPIEPAGGFRANWFGVYQEGRRVFTAEVRVSDQLVASEAATGEEAQELAWRFGREWVRTHLGGTSFIRGVRYLVRYTASRSSPTVGIVGRLRD